MLQSPALHSSASATDPAAIYTTGMSTETTVFVTVKVELDGSVDGFPEPKQNLDEGEFVSRSYLVQMSS